MQTCCERPWCLLRVFWSRIWQKNQSYDVFKVLLKFPAVLLVASGESLSWKAHRIYVKQLNKWGDLILAFDDNNSAQATSKTVGNTI